MLTRMKSSKDVLAGLIFVIFGVLTFLKAQAYGVGTAVEMGPGYFPSATALLLIALGAAAIARGISRKVEDPITPHRILPLFLVFFAIIAFSLLIERAGLFVAAAALIGIACFERLRTKPFEVLAIYVVLTGFCAIVFVSWFDMQLPLFWWQ